MISIMIQSFWFRKRQLQHLIIKKHLLRAPIRQRVAPKSPNNMGGGNSQLVASHLFVGPLEKTGEASPFGKAPNLNEATFKATRMDWAVGTVPSRSLTGNAPEKLPNPNRKVVFQPPFSRANYETSGV